MVDAVSVFQPRAGRIALGLAVWAVAWVVMLLVDPWTELPNLALLLVLAAAVAGLWLPVSASLPVCALSALAFNWTFVPPRGTLSVDLHAHAWLLGAMLLVSWIVSALVSRQRSLADAARQAEARIGQLRTRTRRRCATRWGRRSSVHSAATGGRRARGGAGAGAAQHAAGGHLARPPHAAGHHPGRGVVAARPGRAAVARAAAPPGATIVDEATQLARLTDNTLQLARLDAPGPAICAGLGVGRGAGRQRCCAASHQRDPSGESRAASNPACRCCAATPCCWCSCSTTCSTTR
jgi:hypothetical protein